MNLYKKNDIVLISYPFTNLEAKKIRPALVLALSGNEDVFLAPITSKESISQKAFFLSKNDYENSKLPIDLSVVYKIMTLHQKLIIKKISSITNNAFKNIQSEFQKILFE